MKIVGRSAARRMSASCSDDRRTVTATSLTGAWSRRIDETNRLVYYVTDDHIVVLQAREHLLTQ